MGGAIAISGGDTAKQKALVIIGNQAYQCCVVSKLDSVDG